MLFPAERPDLGDVYVKTGVLRRHPIFIVKISPWFVVNHERGQAQGGFVGVFDSHTGHTLALLNDEHYLSDILPRQKRPVQRAPHRQYLRPALQPLW